MKAVIADDEKYVLVVLKNALRKIHIPIEIIGEAMDGEEAFRLCCETKPDILISNICMPQQDGLSLLERIRQELPDLPVIIYSGYDNFSYAQKAIHYGVEEYLLKPIDEEELEAAIKAVLQRQSAKQQRDRSELMHQLVHLAEGCGPDELRPLLPEEARFLLHAEGCVLLSAAKLGGHSVDPECIRMFGEQPVYALTQEKEAGQVTALLPPALAEEMVANIAEQWGADGYLCDMQRLELPPEHSSMQDAERAQALFHRWHQLLRQANTNLQSYFWRGLPMATDTDQTGQPDQTEATRFNRPYLDRTAAAVRLGKKEYLHGLLQEYRQALLQTYPGGAPVLIKSAAMDLLHQQFTLLGLSRQARQAINREKEQMLRILSAGETLTCLTRCEEMVLSAYLAENNGKQETDLKELIHQYLLDHYRNDVTLDQLAEYLHFNASYTSNLFKRLFGKSFVAYLTAIRIETARALLDSGQFKIYEVAEQVGYPDEKYFFKIFKKVTGCTPKEYQKRKQKP